MIAQAIMASAEVTKVSFTGSTLVGKLIAKEAVKENGFIRLIRRNQLLKIVKQPATGVPFRSLSVYLDQQTLKDFSFERRREAFDKQYAEPVVLIKTSPLLESLKNRC